MKIIPPSGNESVVISYGIVDAKLQYNEYNSK